MDHYVLNFDGSCWPNPGGTAGFGYALSHAGEVIDSGHGVIATGPGMSNNVAEFAALYKGFQSYLTKVTVPSHLQVLGDSNLVVQIMNRKWRASKDKLYYTAYDSALSLLTRIRRKGTTVTFDWIPRELNTLCDGLSKAHNATK